MTRYTASRAETRLFILAKAPLPGRVKTRLAATHGEAFALAAYRAMVANVLDAAFASGLATTVLYAPADAEAAMRRLCGPQVFLAPQVQGDLGVRMAGAFEAAFAAGAAAALLVGADLPLLDGGGLVRAAGLLGESPAVLGPALDGGYYLVGFSRAGYTPAIFRDMAWSGPTVCARTLGLLGAAGRRVALLPRRPDCDTAADVALLRREPWRGRLLGTPFGRFLAETAGDPFDRDPDNRLFVP